MKVKNLNHCPHCGNDTFLEMEDSRDTDCDCGESLSSGFAIVCNFKAGGCGASGGYRDMMKEALTEWNRREEPKP